MRSTATHIYGTIEISAAITHHNIIEQIPSLLKKQQQVIIFRVLLLLLPF
jgi:hypothetical protein